MKAALALLASKCHRKEDKSRAHKVGVEVRRPSSEVAPCRALSEQIARFSPHSHPSISGWSNTFAGLGNGIATVRRGGGRLGSLSTALAL